MNCLTQLFLLLTEEFEPVDAQPVGRYTVALGGHGSCIWPHRVERGRCPSIESDRAKLSVELQVPEQIML